VGGAHSAAEEVEMATEIESQGTVIPARTDPIRVVPLHGIDDLTAPIGAATPAVAPQLTYRGGPLLTSVQVFTVFWGSGWQQQPQAGLIAKLNQFFDKVLSSTLIDQLAEYNVPGKAISHGKRVGTSTVTNLPLGRHATDSTIRHLLQQEIVSNPAFPKPSPNLLYFVYLPPGVSLTSQGGKSCMTFCGYHDSIDGQIFYAAMPYPGCNGCLGGLSDLDALTQTSSHELCEAITDAGPGTGWYDDHNGEIGDICAWKAKKVGGYTVQLEWSNKANNCI
jgi:hypothetical protein